VTCDLFAKSPFVISKIYEYSANKNEFVKRCAFALMCELSFHNKKMQDEQFYPFFELIEQESWDERNFVRKAVNWALRQIGKRNEVLRIKAIECAERILKQNSKSARWIAKDALRELNDEKRILRYT
jgi:3-methyladenine DNA glycosylase AlkD